MEPILDSLADAVLVLDTDGRVTDANAAALALLGYGVDDLRGLRFAHLHADEAEAAECGEHLAAVLTTGSVARCTFALRAKDGSTVPGEQAISPLRAGERITGAVVSVRDPGLTLASERRVREIAEQFPDYVLVVDRQGKVLFVNRTPPGLELDRLTGSVAYQHIPPEYRDMVRAGIQRCFATGEPAEWETPGPDPYGAQGWYRTRLIPLVRDGEVVAATVVATDISEQKRIEHELRESHRATAEEYERERSALRALDQMKNTFLTAVSHELRTPLTSVLGMAQTLEQADALISAEERRDLVKRLAVKARRLERLLGDLLDLDRLARGLVAPVRHPTELGALIRHVAEDVDGLSDRPLEIAADGVIASLDAPKVERMMDNLLSNVVRHTPPGTPVWVRGERRDDGSVLLSVEDAGPGVPEYLRSAVFEEFRQGDQVPLHTPGVGLGLSLVARFAELHGGRAWVEERDGGGAAFRVLLAET